MRSAPHLIRQSIQMADVLFLNKVDIVDAQELAEVEAEVRPLMKVGAEMERVSASQGLPSALMDRVLTDHESGFRRTLPDS
jgi:G3E family GTPase